MATFSSQHPDLIDPLPKAIFFNEYTQLEELFTAVFNVKESKRAYEDAMKVSGLSQFTLKAEGAPVFYDDPISGTRKRVTHSTYGLGFRVTMEMLQDDQFDIIEQMPKDLAKSARDHRENLAWGILNNGGATNTIGLDGLQLFSASHPFLKGSGTSASAYQANIISPAVALSVTGLEAMLTLADTLRDESGRFTPIQLKWLIVPPALKHVAYVLSESEYRPGTSDNDRSTVWTTRTGIEVKSVPYLSSTTTWFALTDKANHGLYFFDRMAPEVDAGKDFLTKDQLHDSVYRGSAVHRDWRGSYASLF